MKFQLLNSTLIWFYKNFSQVLDLLTNYIKINLK